MNSWLKFLGAPDLVDLGRSQPCGHQVGGVVSDLFCDLGPKAPGNQEGLAPLKPDVGGDNSAENYAAATKGFSFHTGDNLKEDNKLCKGYSILTEW